MELVEPPVCQRRHDDRDRRQGGHSGVEGVAGDEQFARVRSHRIGRPHPTQDQEAFSGPLAQVIESNSL